MADESLAPQVSQARGWLATVLPIVERATPVTLLLLLVLGGITLYYQNAEVRRLHDSQKELVHLLLAAKDQQVSLALRVGACEGSKGSRESGRPWPPAPPLPTGLPVETQEERRVCYY